MVDEAKIEARFWKELKASPVMILGVAGSRDGHGQPMTAFFDDEHGPFWFFTTTDNGLVQSLNQSDRAMAHFVAKGHDVFSTLHGNLSVERNQAVIDHFWNSHIEQWYPAGRNDPKLCMLRLDAESATIWLNESNFTAGIQRLFGKDPKEQYKDKVAEVAL
jgi:general stress protein 26